MVDFATLRMGVDTSALAKGERALGEFARAGAQTEAAVDRAMDGVGASVAAAATQVSVSADRMAGATRAATQNLTFQLQDIGMMLAAGQNPFMLAMQQGTQVAGALDQMRGGVGILRGIGMAFASLLNPVSLASLAIIGFGAQAIYWLTGTGNAAQTAMDRMGEAVDNVTSQFSTFETATNDVRDATDRYNAALETANRLQSGDYSTYLGALEQELTARRALLAVEQARLEMRRVELQESIAQGKAKIEELFASQWIFETLNRSHMTEQEIAAVKGIQLERAREIIEANERLFVSQREQQATLALIDSLLAQATGEVQDQKGALDQAAQSAQNLANSAPGPGWMGAAIGETNALISRLVVAYNTAASLRAQSQLNREHAVYSGRGSDPRKFMEGYGEFKPSEEIKRLAEEMDNLTVATGGSGGGGGGGAARAMTEASRSMELARRTAEGLRKEAERPLISAIDGVANAFGNFIAGGLRDFKGFAKSVLQSFKNMIAQMIATAARNRIMIGLGLGGGGMGGTMASAAIGGAGQGGGGLLGGMLGSFGTGTGLAGLAGGTGFLGGLGNAIGGGLGNILNIGANATAAGGGALATIGAALPIIGGLALLFGAFRKRVTELDSGLRLTISGLDAMVETFRTTETRRFFGLSRRVSTSYGPASADIADPVAASVRKIGTSVLDMAESIGLAGDLLAGFSYQVTVSTRGMSREDAARALQDQLENLQDAMAATALGAAGLATALEGETAGQTLQRLATSLTAVNTAFDSLGYQLYGVSIAGAAAASELAQLFGGVEQFTSATTAYYEAFYSAQERAGILTRQLTRRFADLGLALPGTREAFRALVEAQDLTTEAGRNTFAALIQMSGAFGLISDSAEDTAARIRAAVDQINPEDFATALDFNRARGMLLSGPSASVQVQPLQARPAQQQDAKATAQAERNDALMAAINQNIALLKRYADRWDSDALNVRVVT